MNLSNNDSNCGACGHFCTPDRFCEAVQCVCKGSGRLCPPTETCCNGLCTDINSDPDNCGSCNNNCGAGFACQAGQCQAAGPCPAPALAGFSNYIFADSECGSIGDLSVALKVTQDLIPGEDFSIQLNTYTPAGSTVGSVQYVMDFQDGGPSWIVNGDYQGWNCQPNGSCSEIFGTPTWDLINGWVHAVNMGTIPARTIPAGTIFQITLNTDFFSDVVTSMTFEATGLPNATVTLPSSQQFPVAGFQLNVVGDGNGAFVTFASGGAGNIEYSIPSGLLCSLTQAGNVCANPNFGLSTAENSNAIYLPVTPCCGRGIAQSLAIT